MGGVFLRGHLGVQVQCFIFSLCLENVPFFGSVKSSLKNSMAAFKKRWLEGKKRERERKREREGKRRKEQRKRVREKKVKNKNWA